MVPKDNRSAPRRCFFCAVEGRTLTEEHVFPNWLRKRGINGVGTREFVSPDGSTRLQTGGPFNKTAKIVCGICNNGWMSALENEAKPLLETLFSATDASQVTLDDSAQLCLAKWAFKTAAVLTQVDERAPTKPWFPQSARREFRKTGQLPSNTFICIGAGSVSNRQLGLQLGEFQHQPQQVQVRVDGTVTETAPAYVSRFRLLNVVFEIFGMESATLEITVQPSDDLNRMLLQVWPPKHEKLWWPPVSLDAIGGIDGLLKVPVVGIPTQQPPTTKES
ncbi:hypothetical protein [Kitasatospora sp. NPDC056531]|uniref:hypothetical protein n=1 Tax=Kitasatospora sp. NPDC056531 TaxID=3345856 RepID=UPI0036B8C630